MRPRRLGARSRVAIDSEERSIRRTHVAELGGEHDPLAAALNGAPDQFLVLANPVHVRRVEERHTELEGAVDGGDGLVLIGIAVELRHPHAA